MSDQQKLKMWTQVRYDIMMAQACIDDIKNAGGMPVKEQASELLRRCQKANASAQAFERAMAGVEMPKAG